MAHYPDPNDHLRHLRQTSQPMSDSMLMRIGLLAERDTHGIAMCVYCHLAEVSVLTVDHIIPKARFGVNHFDNLCLACARCNQRKSDKTPQEFCPRRFFDIPLLDKPTSRRREALAAKKAKGQKAPAQPLVDHRSDELSARRARVEARSRQVSKLSSNPFASLSFCANCQKVVDDDQAIDHRRRAHLVSSYDPSVDAGNIL